jgi:hypothetical protein
MFREAENFLIASVERCWTAGWQPAELARQGRRGCRTQAGARLVATTIAADNAKRSADVLDPRWRRQLAGLELPETDGRPGWLRDWAISEGLDQRRIVDTVVDVLCNLGVLPPLEPIVPPPGSPTNWSGPAGHGSEVDPVLHRIRALLAKAESSTFEAEATAYTAKAQELMTKHAIDAAAVEQGEGEQHEGPVIVRVPIDRPYVGAKSLLLSGVARAVRCRVVFHRGLELSTVVGFAADVAAVEVMFTSLLLQAQHALARAADGAATGGRTRQRSYRSAFLLGYAYRIGQRLMEINETAVRVAVAERGSAFLPVLRSRSEQVNDYVDELFGPLHRARRRGEYDPAGWVGGEQAANAAHLNAGDITGRR